MEFINVGRECVTYLVTEAEEAEREATRKDEKQEDGSGRCRVVCLDPGRNLE